MRRFVGLAVLFLFAIPFGVSISGCSKNVAPTFCNTGDSGVTVGTPVTIALTPKIYGISLNFAEIGQVTTPSATDCKGNAASVAAFVYGTSDMTIADVEPSNGRLCAGTWNRNTGGGIPDFTVCNPTNKAGIAYISASAQGVTSNPLPVYVHSQVTSVVLGNPSSNCTTDPTTNCCPLATVGVVQAPPYTATSCISQGQQAQLVARVFSGTGANQTNITCQAGHLQYSTQGSSNIVTIDQNGVATANQPGSVLISANTSNAASSAGFFSTCPPVSISLSAAGITTNPVVVNTNFTQPLVATAVDMNNVVLTGLTLEYVSTSPKTIPAGSGSVTPTFGGSASISALCQPPTCNPSSLSQIGLFGNGKPVTSNPVNVTTPATNATVLFMASTQSQYVVPQDFTSNAVGAPFLLPYVPNSMVISNDGSTIYMGSSTGLMVLNVVNSLSLTRTDVTSPGVVLGVSPDGSTIVVADPTRNTTYVESAGGGVITTFGGIGTHASWTADSQNVYITTGTVVTPPTMNTPAVMAPGPTVFVYSPFNGPLTVTNSVPASDVAVTVPGVGAYFAGPTTLARSYCSISTPGTTVNGVLSENNVFYPGADSAAVPTDRIAATNNGRHILGATATPKATLNDLLVNIPSSNTTGAPVSVACPVNGTLTFSNTPAPTVLGPVNAAAITGVFPTSDSSLAYVTYTGSGGVLPAYATAANGVGTTTYIKLSGTATAPIAGIDSSDDSAFYAATSGDNLVHVITRSTLTDTTTIAPKLTDPTGNTVPVNLLAQKPRKTT